jgi:hypothetical protein
MSILIRLFSAPLRLCAMPNLLNPAPQALTPLQIIAVSSKLFKKAYGL